MIFQFDWDFEKASLNLDKHKVSFERSCSIFRDPNALSIYDNEHSEYEDRWITLGIDETGVLLVVVHTYKEISENVTMVRIISGRKATKNEIRKYNKV
jgi:uncharacterized protein